MTRKTKVVVNGFTRRLDLGEAIQKSMAAGNYEPEQTAWVKQTLRPGSRFVDVGANFGYYASLASRIVGSTGRVLAFEPSPVAQASLREMIQDNGIANIELCAAAVGDHPGQIEILLPSDTQLHSPSVFPCDDSFIPHSVPLVTLDSYEALNDGVLIDLIKIDVEGFEPNVIQGMKALVSRRQVRHLSCEFNSGWLRRNNGTTPAQLLDMILSLGFTVVAKTEKITGMERGGVIPYELQDILFAFSA